MYAEYLPDALLATDTAGRYAAYKTGIESGFLTIDEVRRKENLPALPERVSRSDERPPHPTGARSPPSGWVRRVPSAITRSTRIDQPDLRRCRGCSAPSSPGPA